MQATPLLSWRYVQYHSLQLLTFFFRLHLRIAFFSRLDKNETAALTALIKSDRLALESVAEVLRLKEEDKSSEELIHSHFLDLQPPRGKSRKAQKQKCDRGNK